MGTIDGSAKNKFMLTAIDADLNDSEFHTVDLFRIKIWTDDRGGTETVVYNNALGNNSDESMTEIGGG